MAPGNVTTGRIVLVKVQQENQYDNGLRPAIVTGVHKKGISVTIFADCACDEQAPPGFGTVLNRRDIAYGEGTYKWRWPRDDDNLFGEPLAEEPEDLPCEGQDEDLPCEGQDEVDAVFDNSTPTKTEEASSN